MNERNLLNMVFDTMRGYEPPSTAIAHRIICFFFARYLGVSFENMTERNIDEMVLHRLQQDCHEEVIAAYKILSAYKMHENTLKHVLSALDLLKEDDTFWKRAIEEAFSSPHLGLNDQFAKTPDPLNELGIQLLNPVNGTFYDGVAGIGSSMIAAHRHAQKHGGKLEFFLQEISETAYAVSVLLAFLNGIEDAHMACGDTLLDPQYTLGDRELMTFDYSLMFPPLGHRWSKNDMVWDIRYDRFDRFLSHIPPRSSTEWLFVQHQYASLKKGGRGIIAMTSGSLFNGATAKIRQAFIESGIIECIIALPSGALMPLSGVNLNLIVLQGQKRPLSQVRLIDADKLLKQPARGRGQSSISEDLIEKVCRLYRTQKDTAGVSRLVTPDELARNNFDLSPARYFEKKELATEFGLVRIKDTSVLETKLSDVAAILRGLNVSTAAEPAPEGPYKIINYADVQDGSVDIARLPRYRPVTHYDLEKYRVYAGDVLISCKGAATKITVIPPLEPGERVLFSVNFMVLRCDPAQYDPRYIKSYLESPVGALFLQERKSVSSIVILTARELSQIPIPTLPLAAQQKALDAWQEKDQAIKKQVAELYIQSRNAKWTLYKELGLENIMTLESEE